MKVLICGLPGSGKSTLTKQLQLYIPHSVWLNADYVRENMHKHLGFSVEDRIEHARLMGLWAGLISQSSCIALADFVCPLPETREAFSPDMMIFMDTIKSGRYEDTNKMFIPPSGSNVLTIPAWNYDINHVVGNIFSFHYHREFNVK